MVKSRKSKLENRLKEILKQKTPDINDIISVVDDYEKNNLKTITKLKKKKSLDMKQINGALKQTISAHGPITTQYINSASKRIHGSLLIDEERTKTQWFKTLVKIIVFFLVLLLV